MPTRSLRPYAATDAGACAEMLAREGLTPDVMAFERLPTVVLEEGGRALGFVTVALEHGVFPSVQHFVIDRAARSPSRVRFLLRALRTLVRDAGYPRFIVHAEPAYLRRLIEWYWRVQPYAFDADRAFYLVRA